MIARAVVICAALVTVATSAPAVSAQNHPRTPWGEPDLSGVWAVSNTASSAVDKFGLADLQRLYKPEARAEMAKLTANDDPVRQCVPHAFPRVLVSGDRFQIVQAPRLLTVLIEPTHAYRLIPTDGRPHLNPRLLFPTFQGDSTARFEGDTLVVDVIGFNGRNWIAGGSDKSFPQGAAGFITSDTSHIVERWRRVNADLLEYQATLDDPTLLIGLWTTPKITIQRQPVGQIAESKCVREQPQQERAR